MNATIRAQNGKVARSHRNSHGPRSKHPPWVITKHRIKFKKQIFTCMKNLFFDSRRQESDPDILSMIRANFTALFGPEECELMLEFMVNEAQNYSTPIERRAITNLENLKSHNEPGQDSIYNALTNRPSHISLETAFSNLDFQRAFLAVLPLLRRENCLCMCKEICKDDLYHYELFSLLENYVKASENDGTVARVQRLLHIREGESWAEYFELPSLH